MQSDTVIDDNYESIIITKYGAFKNLTKPQMLILILVKILQDKIEIKQKRMICTHYF